MLDTDASIYMLDIVANIYARFRCLYIHLTYAIKYTMLVLPFISGFTILY